jgi:hypothetical protein
MIEANVLIMNARLLTMDAQMSVFENGFIGVTETRFLISGRETPFRSMPRKSSTLRGLRPPRIDQRPHPRLYEPF